MAAPQISIAASITSDREMQIQAMITAAWDDATATWQRILGGDLYRATAPKINFVSSVRASHCYGLYIGAGPVYCSGNATIFVSVASMNDLDKRFPGVGNAGLAFLVAHEIGHHVQSMMGRFRVINEMARQNMNRQRELALRFELEADCLAGVWAHNSPNFAATEAVRAGIAASVDAIGDDKILAASGAIVEPANFTHGSSQQRVHWFRRGLERGAIDACNVLQADTF
ncbi:MAG TPA: neutral zinc metallopeptidase [Hyphomicrobium sp.]|nr:neutral zinc metallopeptidase [Hyphomicrobium sp.]